MHIRLGNIVRDIVTGFTGTVVSRIEFINGCIQFGVAPKSSKDGKYPDTQYIDYQRLEFLKDGVADKLSTRDAGGPQIDAPRS